MYILKAGQSDRRSDSDLESDMFAVKLSRSGIPLAVSNETKKLDSMRRLIF